MRLSHRATSIAAALTLAIGVSAVTTSSAASADTRHTSATATSASLRLGTKPLAAILLADSKGFDNNGKDFDILRAAVLAVLKAKPNSPVKVLTDGHVALTAFLPDDRAFELLVEDITGARHLSSEAATFKAVAGLGVNTVETVLLYHVVPGATITAKDVLKAEGANLKTAQGGTVRVGIKLDFPHIEFRLRDADTNDTDPKVIAVDVNKGNKQIAHVIDRVLRPVDLP